MHLLKNDFHLDSEIILGRSNVTNPRDIHVTVFNSEQWNSMKHFPFSHYDSEFVHSFDEIQYYNTASQEEIESMSKHDEDVPIFEESPRYIGMLTWYSSK